MVELFGVFFEFGVFGVYLFFEFIVSFFEFGVDGGLGFGDGLLM